MVRHAHKRRPVSCTYADLVFIQNGMLQPWLEEKGLGDTTQVRSVQGAEHRWLQTDMPANKFD